MNSQEIQSLYVRVSRSESSILLEVANVIWEGPHTPITKWSTYKKLPQTSTEVQMVAAKEELLKNPKHFLTCQLCDRLKPIGWMHGDTMCHSCAESELGIVH